MNWPVIEGIIYAEEDQPHEILGVHKKGHDLVFQTYQPGAVAVSIVLPDEESKIKMEMADEEGYFAAILPYRIIDRYHYEVEYPEHRYSLTEDAYHFPSAITETDLQKFHAGTHETIYEKLGAHLMKLDGTSGCEFALWAPNAVRVSAIGSFNEWNGKIHQMRRLGKSGVFEIFIPGAKEKDLYKFEILLKNGKIVQKADPFAFAQEEQPGNASKVVKTENYVWQDEEWIESRISNAGSSKPVSIYEVYLGSFLKPKDGRRYCSYRECAADLAKYIVRMGFTHVELMPLMEHPRDTSLGYQITGYYAPTSRYGDPEDFKYLIDTLHQAGIGVISDWVPAYFPNEEYGLADFDGTPLYERKDIRSRWYQDLGTLFFDYSSREVRNFLQGNLLYWAGVFHIDGFRLVDVSSMLYLDYGRRDGISITNIYGENTNLEAVDFLKHLNAVVRKSYPGVLMIAEESTGWGGLTSNIEDGGFGFDMKWNCAWKEDFYHYIQFDPFFRSYHHQDITDHMVYAFCDTYVLPFSHDDVSHGKPSLFERMPGSLEEKFAGMRMTFAYQTTHPGRKLIFMGQELGEPDSWNEEREIEWYLQVCQMNQRLQKCVGDLNMLYRKHPALYQSDDCEDSFHWIDCMNSQNCCISFIRSGVCEDTGEEEKLFVICNFANVMKMLPVGVPIPGSYKEIFNTDLEIYGGNGFVNSRMKKSSEKGVDGQPFSIKMNMAPLSISVFQYLNN